MTHNTTALGAPITIRERAISHLSLSAQSKFARLDSFKPLARALVRQYVDTVESLQRVLEGSRPSHLPSDLTWKKEPEGFIFTSSTSNFSAHLDNDGRLLVRRGAKHTSFRVADNRNGSLKLVRTMCCPRRGRQVVKHAEVDLDQGSRSYRVEQLTGPSNGNASPAARVRISRLRSGSTVLEPRRASGL